MAPPEHPTRRRLLGAALQLGDQRALSAVTVDEITTTAGVAKGTFYVHFPDRDHFVGALHDEVQRALAERVRGAISGKPAGAVRLRLGCEAYLDACLTLAGVKTLTRSHDLADDSDDRRWIAGCRIDLSAMGAADAESAAILLVAAVRGIVMSEQAAGRQDGLREACWSLFRISQLHPPAL